MPQLAERVAPDDAITVRHFLDHHPLLLGLEAVVNALMPACETIALSAGEVLFEAGTPVTSTYLQIEGVLALCQPCSGAEPTVTHLIGPAVLGELEFLSASSSVRTQALTARALRPTLLLQCDARTFAQTLEAHPEACVRLLRDLADRSLRSTSRQMAAHCRINERLACFILSHCEWAGRLSARGIEIRHPLPARELATCLGVTQRSVAGVISEWKRSGIVQHHKGWLVVRDRAALEQQRGDADIHFNHTMRRTQY